METISQRELRNNSADVMRGLERGMSYRITNRGIPVGVLSPIGASTLDDHVVRDGTQDMTFAVGVRINARTADVLDDFRGDR